MFNTTFHEKKRVVEVKASTDDPIKGNKRKHKVYYGLFR